MSRPIIALAGALLLAATTLARAAAAASVPLSSIPLASGALPKVQETARIDGVRKEGDLFAAALDQPVCVGIFDPATEDYEATGVVGYWDGDPGPQELEVLRLETDGEPYLDRRVVDHLSPLGHATVLRHVRIPLALMVGGVVPAYAYRTKTRLHVFVPQGFDLPVDAFDPRLGMRPGCGFAMITVTLPGGVAGESVLPPRAMKESERWLADVSEAFDLEQKRFPKGRPAPPPSWTVNVSVSQVTRDPEPLVSVVVVAPREPAGP